MHNVAVKSDGTVWAWGWNAFGQLGDGTTNDAYDAGPDRAGSVPPLTSVTKLGGRPYFTLAVKSDGTIWAWGMNQYGQMGNGTVNPLSGPQVTVPVQVSNSGPGGAINNPLAGHLRLSVRRGPGDEWHGLDLGQRHAWRAGQRHHRQQLYSRRKCPA